MYVCMYVHSPSSLGSGLGLGLGLYHHVCMYVWYVRMYTLHPRLPACTYVCDVCMYVCTYVHSPSSCPHTPSLCLVIDTLVCTLPPCTLLATPPTHPPTLTHAHLVLPRPHSPTRPDDLSTPPHLHTHPHSPTRTSRRPCAWHSYFALRIPPCPFHHVPESSRFTSPSPHG